MSPFTLRPNCIVVMIVNHPRATRYGKAVRFALPTSAPPGSRNAGPEIGFPADRAVIAQLMPLPFPAERRMSLVSSAQC